MTGHIEMTVEEKHKLFKLLRILRRPRNERRLRNQRFQARSMPALIDLRKLKGAL